LGFGQRRANKIVPDANLSTERQSSSVFKKPLKSKKEIVIIKVSILYPNEEGSRFDWGYYLKNGYIRNSQLGKSMLNQVCTGYLCFS
jgi:hypothetical protein